jgi:hypothetical protein
MRTSVRLCIGFAVVATSGCVVKVNGEVHKFGLSGEEEKKTPEKAAGADGASADALAAELAGGTTPSGQSVTLKPDFAPNPTVLGNFTSKAEVSISAQPHGVSRCSGYVGEGPAVVLNLTSPRKNTRISAPGSELILAEFGDRQYVCKDTSSIGETPSVMLDEWPAGEIKLFVGGDKDKTFKYELRVEDEKRPLDIAWKSTVKAIEIGDLPKDPIVISELTATTAGLKDHHGGCSSGYFRETPDVAFSLKRPLGDVTIEVRSAKPVQVQIIGPLTDDGRNIRTSCMNDDRTSFNRMEAGLYGLKIGTDASGAEVLYHVVVRGKDTSRNPVLAPSKSVEQASVDESVLTWHYPQLTQADAENSEANREALFLSAPKALFVFPKFSMDKSVAEILGGAGASSNDKAKNAPVPEYPKENEPLLLLNKNGYVMAADGSLFRVNLKDLAADPGGAVAVPAAPRNTGLSFERALASKGPEDAKAVAAYEKAQKDLETCESRSSSSVEGTFQSLCGSLEKAVDKKKEALIVEMTKNRTARRAASLAKVKPRVETLFKK